MVCLLNAHKVWQGKKETGGVPLFGVLTAKLSH